MFTVTYILQDTEIIEYSTYNFEPNVLGLGLVFMQWRACIRMLLLLKVISSRNLASDS